MELTPRAQKLLKEAEQQAIRFGDSRIGAEHLQLAILGDPDGIPAQVLRELVDLGLVREKLVAQIQPPPRPGFEQYPRPCGSAVIHDASGQPRIDANGQLQQYFVDRESQPIRSSSGKLIHVEWGDDGKPLLDAEGELVLREVHLDPDSYDHLGHPLR